MKRRLLIAKALVHRPRVAFLDEPTAGVDVELRRDLWTYVRKLRAEGTTIVLTTHYLEEAEELADRVAVIDHGELITVDKPDALLMASTARSGCASRSPRRSPCRAADGCARSAPRSTTRRIECDRCPIEATLGDAARRASPRCPIACIDVRTEQPSLEQVFLALTETGRGMNLIGFRTLLAKETRRFLKVPGQTVAQPVVTTALYFLVFGFALGGRCARSTASPTCASSCPAWSCWSLIQNAFLNTASSMFITKMQGTIVDLLVAPLAPLELLGAFTLAAVVRGLLVGGIAWLVAAIFTGFASRTPAGCSPSRCSSRRRSRSSGSSIAIWSDKFEQLNFIPTFVITPLTFLGGVFYSARMLPEPWTTITKLNPILYMVEGLRYGFLGQSSASPWLGLILTLLLTILSALVVWVMLARGYKLRA